ncbi:hypothetical protein ACHHYP_18012 [Achlya hypogyna]|uniref:tRNA (guanine(9)-N(1))-methyltransferase n=1 Tax=Achlya hypogyna TaxID=1202772 RepID=A0A1V9ZRN8_ACHHY|nr:hypothetical protein ACHHYP_18012 [Achlya hypogyna]
MSRNPWTVALWVGVTIAVVAVTMWVQEVSDEAAAKKRAAKKQRRQDRIEYRRAQHDARRKDRKREQQAARQEADEAITSTLTPEEKKRYYEEKIAQKRLAKARLEDKLNSAMATGLRVVVDLAFLQEQTQRERNSVIKQAACAYGAMKKAEHPSLLSLHFASYHGEIAALCDKRGVGSWKATRHPEPIDEVFPNDELIFLSPDSPNVLTEVNPRAVYVIGGIVDRSVRKGQSLSKARGLGNVRTARLPVQETLHVRSNVLNIDTVLLSLLEFINCGDWATTFERTLPKRIYWPTEPTT